MKEGEGARGGSMQYVEPSQLQMIILACMELVPVCLCVLAPANLCPCEIWSLCKVG